MDAKRVTTRRSVGGTRRGPAAAGAATVERTERRVHQVLGVTFLLLALYVAVQAGWTLATRHIPEESLVGIGFAIAPLIVMPLVAWGKMRAAR